MQHRRTETRATTRPRRFACELAVFINGADSAHWVRPARAGADARAFRLRWSDLGGWHACVVTRDAGGERCTCPARTRCEHIRALRAVHLLEARP